MSPSDEAPKFFECLRNVYVNLKHGSVVDIKGNLKKYMELGETYIPMVVKWGSVIGTLSKCNLVTINAILEGIAAIGTWAACLAAVVLIKNAIDKETSDAIKHVKLMLNNVLEYVEKRYVAIEKRMDEIDPMILDIKLLTRRDDVNALDELLITLKEKVRLCNLDIKESIEKIQEMNVLLTSKAKAMNGKCKNGIISTFLFAAGGLVGLGVATVATGGLAVVALTAAGVAIASEAGSAYFVISCKESEKVFNGMKVHLNQILGDFERFKKRLDAHIEELKLSNINLTSV